MTTGIFTIFWHFLDKMIYQLFNKKSAHQFILKIIITVAAGLNKSYHGNSLFACCLSLGKSSIPLQCLFLRNRKAITLKVFYREAYRMKRKHIQLKFIKALFSLLQPEHSGHQLFLLSVSYMWRHVCLCLSSLCQHWSQTPISWISSFTSHASLC